MIHIKPSHYISFMVTHYRYQPYSIYNETTHFRYLCPLLMAHQCIEGIINYHPPNIIHEEYYPSLISSHDDYLCMVPMALKPLLEPSPNSLQMSIREILLPPRANAMQHYIHCFSSSIGTMTKVSYSSFHGVNITSPFMKVAPFRTT